MSNPVYSPPAYCEICGLFVPVEEYAKHRQGSNLRCAYNNYDFVKLEGNNRDYAVVFGSTDKDGNLIPGDLDNADKMLSRSVPGSRNQSRRNSATPVVSVTGSTKKSRRNSAISVQDAQVLKGRDCPVCKQLVDEKTMNRHRGGSDKYCVYKHYELIRDTKVDGGFRIAFGRIEKQSGRIISPTLRGREEYVNPAQENLTQRHQRQEFLKTYRKRHAHTYEHLHKPVLREKPRMLYRGQHSGPMNSDLLFPDDLSLVQMILMVIALMAAGFIAGRQIGEIPNLSKSALLQFFQVLQKEQ